MVDNFIQISHEGFNAHWLPAHECPMDGECRRRDFDTKSACWVGPSHEHHKYMRSVSSRQYVRASRLNGQHISHISSNREWRGGYTLWDRSNYRPVSLLCCISNIFERVVYQHAYGNLTKNNQSINQSNFYSANIPSVARLTGATAESLFNSKIDKAVP